MKRYRSHKVVEAERVIEARLRPGGGWWLVLDGGSVVDVTDEWHDQKRGGHEGLCGGYFVRYEDGLTSRNPAKPPLHLSDADRLRWVELAKRERALMRGLEQMDGNERIPPADKERVILSNERQLNRVEKELRQLEGLS